MIRATCWSESLAAWVPRRGYACAIAPAQGRWYHCLGPSRCWVGGSEVSDESMRPSARAPIERLRGGGGGGGGGGLGEGFGRLLQQRYLTRAGTGRAPSLSRRAILGAAASSYCCTRARPALGTPSASDEEVLEARLVQALESGGVAGASLSPAHVASVEAIARALEALGGDSLLSAPSWERHSSPPLPPMGRPRLALGGTPPCGATVPLRARLEATCTCTCACTCACACRAHPCMCM